MNAAHIHLVVNHSGLFASLFGGLLLAAGVYSRHKALVDAGLVLAVVAGLGAGAAALSGHRAEGIVEHLAGVSETTIHEHEEAAEAALWASVVLGVLALAGLALPAGKAGLKRAAVISSLVMTVVVFGAIARAANLGGHIRHSEITAPPIDSGS